MSALERLERLFAQRKPGDGFTSAQIEIRAVREEMREADFVCSTESIDSHGTILRQDWDLERFSRNPVVLYAHNSRELPIGQARNVRVENGQLLATIWFSDAHERARECWRLVVEKTLRGVSVGFDWTSYGFEKINGVEVLVLSGLILHELSVTPVPSNEDALCQLRARASATPDDASPVKPVPQSPYRTPAVRGDGDSHMDPKEIEKLQQRTAELSVKTTELEAQNIALAKERDAANKTIATLDTQNKRLETERDAAIVERDAAVKRADAAEKASIEMEVDKLVGRKISAAEKPEFVELRTTNPKLFERMVAQRKDMKLDEPVIPAEKPEDRSTRSDDSEDEATKDFVELLKAARQRK